MASPFFHFESPRVIQRQDLCWLACYMWVTGLCFETLSQTIPHSEHQEDWTGALFMTNQTQRRLTHGLEKRRSLRETLFDEIMPWKENLSIHSWWEKRVNLREWRALNVCQSVCVVVTFNNCDHWSNYKMWIKCKQYTKLNNMCF